MLSHFPPTEGERLVTESMLHAEVQAVRTEIQAVRTDMYAMGNRIILWNIGFTMTWSGVLLAAIKFT